MYSIATIIGSHAGEEIGNIFNRKINDITNYRHTYWLFHSNKVTKDKFKLVVPKKIYFLQSKTKNGAKPTKRAQVAKYFSSYTHGTIQPIDLNLSPVTGKLSKVTKALKLSKIDLRDPFEFYFDKSLIKFNQFAGTHIFEEVENVKGIQNKDYRICIGIGIVDDLGTVSESDV